MSWQWSVPERTRRDGRFRRGGGAFKTATKSDLVRAVKAELGIRSEEARVIVEAVFRGIMDAVARGEKVELRGIGTFRRKPAPARWARDFGRGEPVRVAAGSRVSYRVSRRLRARLNSSASGGDGTPRP